MGRHLQRYCELWREDLERRPEEVKRSGPGMDSTHVPAPALPPLQPSAVGSSAPLIILRVHGCPLRRRVIKAEPGKAVEGALEALGSMPAIA